VKLWSIIILATKDSSHPKYQMPHQLLLRLFGSLSYLDILLAGDHSAGALIVIVPGICSQSTPLSILPKFYSSTTVIENYALARPTTTWAQCRGRQRRLFVIQKPGSERDQL